MPSARAAARRQHNNHFNNIRFVVAKELANVCKLRTKTRFKIKFLLPQGKNIEVKQDGNVVRQMRVCRRARLEVNIVMELINVLFSVSYS